MASIIRIKRSGTAASAPSPLANGELAYSAAAGTQGNGGDRLYIGFGTETAGNAANQFVIGGKYFTDMLDHVHGVVTASSALIVDANKKLDELNVDNLTLNANTISSTDSNGNISLDPNGTGYVQIVGTNGLVIPVGTTAQQGPAVQGAIRYNNEISQFEGYSGANWSSLGGVRSVDGLTFITAESTPSSSDDTLRFVTNNTLAMSIDTDSLDIQSKIATTTLNATTVSSTTSSGALVVVGGVGIGGNLNVAGDFGLTGAFALNGDVAINGGDLFSTAATFNLLNKDSTGSATNDGPATVNAFLGATTVSIGAATGTTTINHNAQIIGTLNVDGTTQLDGAVTIAASGTRSNLTVYGAAIDISATANSTFGVTAATGTAITQVIQSTNSVGDAHLDINVKNDFTLDATSVSIDSTDNSNLTMTSNNASNKTLTIDAINSGAGEAIIAVGSNSTDKVNITSEGTAGMILLTSNEVQADVNTLDINAKNVTIDTVGSGNSLIATTTAATVNATTVTFQGTAGAGTDMTLTMTGQLNVDNVRIDGNTIFTTDNSNTLYLDPAPMADNGGTVVIKGNLQVDGTTTTVNSTTVTIDDPVFSLGGDTTPSADDNLDRGIDFKWHNGTDARLGFFGYDDSAAEFTFISDADLTGGVYTPRVAGVFGNLRFSKLTLVDTTEATTTTAASMVLAGGLGIAKDIRTAADIIGAGPATSDIDGFNIDGGTY
jgi:hypothetical protein